MRGCGRRAGGRVCAGGREGGERSARAARAPALPASRPPRCLPPARTGCLPPPTLLLAPALHGSLPAAARFVLPPEDGSDLSQLGSYLKGGSAPAFLLTWRNGGRIQPHSPKPGRIFGRAAERIWSDTANCFPFVQKATLPSALAKDQLLNCVCPHPFSGGVRASRGVKLLWLVRLGVEGARLPVPAAGARKGC